MIEETGDVGLVPVLVGWTIEVDVSERIEEGTDAEYAEADGPVAMEDASVAVGGEAVPAGEVSVPAAGHAGAP